MWRASRVFPRKEKAGQEPSTLRPAASLSPRGGLRAVSGHEELEGCRLSPTHGRMPQGGAGSAVTGQRDSPVLVFLESSRERGSLREWVKELTEELRKRTSGADAPSAAASDLRSRPGVQRDRGSAG